MYLLIVATLFSFQVNLVGKTFTYFDRITGSSESYTFIDNKKLKWVGKTEFGGKQYQDICYGTYSIEANKIRVIYACDDKEVYPDPHKEVFIFSSLNNTLTTTIHYDQTRKPRLFSLIK